MAAFGLGERVDDVVNRHSTNGGASLRGGLAKKTEVDVLANSYSRRAIALANVPVTQVVNDGRCWIPCVAKRQALVLYSVRLWGG